MSELNIELLNNNVPSGTFDCGNETINQYVEESYFATLTQQAYAYKILYKGILVGYYMISIKDIEAEECTDDVSDYLAEFFSKKFYSIHINYLAIDKKYQGKGIGTWMLKMIIKQIRENIINSLPIRLITIDAVKDKVEWYSKEGFIKMASSLPGQDGYNVYMYIDCIKNKEKLIEYAEECT